MNRRRCRGLAIASLAVCLIAAQCRPDISIISASFDAAGTDPDAAGILMSELRRGRQSLTVAATGLDPLHAYELRVDGEPGLAFSTDAAGVVLVELETGEVIDLRWGLVTIGDAGGDVLAMDLSGANDPSDLAIDERTRLDTTPLLGSGNATVRFIIESDGRRRLKVQLGSVPQGDYALFVDGLHKATLTAGTDGRGVVEFDTQLEPGKVPLDFDPRGAVVDVVANGDVLFSGPVEARIPKLNDCVDTEQVTPLLGIGSGQGGKGEARLRTRSDCDRDLRVEIEDVAEGTYALCSDGVFRGRLDAVFNPAESEVEGELEFDTDVDEADERPFDFEVDLATIEVRGDEPSVVPGDPCPATDVVFQIGEGGPNACVEEQVEVFLGVFPPVAGGKAKVRRRTRDDCDKDVRTEIQDVPEGSYAFCVAGVLRGRIDAAFDPLQDEVRGEIQFDTDVDEPGELPLDFAVDLEEVEIRLDDPGVAVGSPCPATELAFAGTEAGPAGPAICEPFEREVPLLNDGVDPDAKGKARYRVEPDCDRDFRVEVENLAAGAYDLTVGGVPRGVIQVALDPSTGELEGQIEFDNEPDEPGELPFPADLEPRGERVEVAQGASVLLSRTFPQ